MKPEVVQGFRFSPQQERVWLLRRIESGDPYRTACAVRIHGPLDPEALAAAARRAVERNEILRTVFRSLPGASIPVQVILDEPALAFRAVDLSDLRAEERETWLWELQREANGPFDLEDGPLLRLVLARLSPNEHRLFLTLHALCGDAATLLNLVGQIGRDCSSMGEGEEPLQYADLAEFFNELLETEEMAAGREYWLERQLAAVLDLTLPFDGTGDPFTAPPAGLAVAAIDGRLRARLDDFARVSAAPLANVLLGAWVTLLWRLTGRVDLAIATVHDGRAYEGLDAALGLFARCLPIFCRLAPELSFAELLAKIESERSEANRWQGSFSWRLLEKGWAAEDPIPTSFLAFTFTELPAARRYGELSFAIEQLGATIDRGRLELTCAAGSERIDLQLQASPALCSPVEAQRLLVQLTALLDSAVASPLQRIGELPVLTEAERHQLLTESNDTDFELGAEERLHELVARQCRETPDRIAAVEEGGTLTFGALDAQAGRIAGELLLRGIRTDELVGICLDRSLEMLVAILGVLKAGAAYLPLDPDYPRDRLAFMIADARPRLIMTQRSLRHGLESHGVPTLVVDEDRSAAPAGELPQAAGLATADNLAYVIYTSGSTGRPKGVAVSHRAIANRLLWMQRHFPIGEEDGVVLKTAFGFDASIWEIFVPLLAGARVIVARPGGHQDSTYLVRLVREQQATVLQLVPSMLRVVVEESELPECASLRRLFCGGEAFPGELQRRFATRHGAELHNLYGPTEAAIDAAHWTCRPDDAPAVLPLGQPLANVRVYVLSPRLVPVPRGVAGELCIGGRGLARGYLGRPDLTAGRFVPDAQSGRPGERLYRTGDLARQRADGALEFLGRIDQQVKIRGYRVELGEIEASLARHPAVAQAAVALRSDERGDRLIAYAVLRGAAVEPAELRALLAGSLPEPMVPAVVVVLSALPFLPNGKLDRSALPEPPDTATAGAGKEAPRNLTEELLVGIWSDVLGAAGIGIRDSFFDLGGHSISATQMAARVRAAFGVDLTLRAFFDHPTIAEIAATVDAMRRAGQARSTPPMEPLSRDLPLPLSFAQRRLWFLDQLQPGNTAYNVGLAFSLAGRLSLPALAAALNAVVQRHEVLRTTFPSGDGEPVQVAAAALDLALPVVDLRGLPEAVRDGVVQRLASAAAGLPFDLAHGPLVRALALRTGDAELTAVLALHHIVTDGWSTGILLREIAELYRAAVQRRPADLPELPIQYADFAHWQRRWLQGEELDAQLAYWRERLAALPVLQLPTDHPRPALQTFRGATQPVLLPAATTERLALLGRQHGASLFMALAAAFDLLLARLSGSRDVAIGFPVAGRARPEVEALIGLFVNTLVLRTDLTGNPGLETVVERIQGEVLAASAYQDLPFERLVESLQIERDLSQNPIFQVMLILQNRPRRELEIEGLTLRTLPVKTGTAKLDLSLDLVETANGLVGAFEYNSDLFEPATMERWARHFAHLLESALATPERPFPELDLLGEAERRQILEGWNDTAVSYRLQPLHHLIEEQVARAPEALALVGEGERLSYAEMDRRAGLWARHLGSLGVGPDTPVGICAERSVEMVIGLLAILKAGGAYLPLDPRYPRERLAFVMRDAGLELVLTQERLRGDLPEEGVRYLYLDGEPPAGPGAVVPAEVDLANLAYIIYTSGSTGFPKGAMVAHAGIANRLLWMQDAYPLGADDRVLQKTPYTFDVSVWELFWPLLAGATLVIARPEGHRDSAYLVSLIAAEQVTTLHFVPSMLQVFLEEPRAAECRSLRRILCSGEALPVEVANRCLARFAACGTELHNLYGPTEASVDVSFWACRPAERMQTTPIGRPIANLRLYVVDTELLPVARGVPGELLIGGAGLGRGYLGRPDLTAERFIPDPFAAEPGGRLYRTGDLARFLPEGDVEFRGRIDFQVKIRGFRIELGEIEAVLERHPAVRQAVVVAGDQRLVAYAVPGEGAAPAPAELRAHLAASLPDYMVPAAFVLLPALPLSPNGKVDRRALPAPGDEHRGDGGGGDQAMPRTPAEEILAGLWQRLLGREQVGRDESFFHLGGHSLLATQVLSRLRDDLGVDLPLRAFFEGPTIAELAAALERARGAQQRPLPPLRRLPRHGALPLSFAQERVWFVEQLVRDNPVYNISAVLGLAGRLDVPALAAAFSEIVRRHEALRTTFQEVAGEPMQIVGPAAPVPVPLVDLSGLAEPRCGAESLRLQVAEARRPFELTRGPLLRVCLLRTDAREHLVLFTVHHIVSDAWSMNLFGRELAAHYAAFETGAAAALPELPIQYADYAAWQREWLTGEVLEGELAFWGQRLAGLPNLDLPTDRPRPPVQTFRGERCSRVLPDGTVDGLRALGAAHGITPFMALLAAFEALVGRYSGQEDAGIGFPIANRRWTEVEPLIGFFVNMLVLRMDLAGDPSYLELLKRVRATALDAYMHQDVPFEILVGHLQPERDLSRNPLVQVAFQLLHSPGGQSELPGLALTRPQQEGAVVRFDLELVVSEVGGRLLTHLDYCSDLFADATATRMLGHFENLVAAILADPGCRLSDLALLSAGERQQLLRVWNDPDAAWPGGETLHGLFEAQAATRPGAPAVAFELDEMSYGELNAAANRLAHHLRSLGVGPETLVGVCTERSVGLVVGLLGVLKAGGAYVPLDPAYPRERLTYMMDDAGISVLLAQRSLLVELPRLAASFVDVDDPGSWSGSAENPRPLATAESLAYVIYTSGSTGQPKGVMVTHGHVVRLFAATREWFAFDARDTWTLFHSYAFDFSVWELWGALLHGGRLVVVPYWASRSPEAFHKLVSGEGVTVLNQTPSAFQELVRSEEELGRVDPGGTLRLVIFGGEALGLPALRPWFERHGERLPLLVNMYGITETTVHVTYRPVSTADLHNTGSPVGRPIPDLQVHLVDRALQLVPVGVPGEMLVGGAGVARGYLARPELTAERFVPDPFAGAPGARLYRSGDLARRLPNGELEYLGRIDHQVKIRGFRIELGEIATLLARHPGVENVLVDVRNDPAAGAQIVAYVVPGRELGQGPELVPELRGLARQHLPDYMVPAAFVLVDEMPLTANGKVDRRALAALHGTGVEEAVHTAPRTPVEAVLAGIWCELLNRERVGVDESFFDLGGHSLLASRAIARISRIFHVDVPLRTIFESPTVAGLAEQVEQALEAGETPPPPAIEPVPRDRDLPLSFTQQRIWFLDQLMPGSFTYNMPVVIRFRGPLDVATFGRCLDELVARHETLRTTFRVANGQPVQAIAPPAPCPLPVIDLRALPAAARDAESRRLVRQQIERPFDLSRGPLLRVALERLAADEHLLVLAMHHIVSDGWSMGIFVREAIALYRAFTTGAPSPLPPLPLQFADFAGWQRRWLSGSALQAQLAYWRRQLGDDPPPLELPTDRPRPLTQTTNGRSLSLAMSPALTAAVKDLARVEGATPFILLLSALKALLARYSGQDDLTVGTPVAGRTRVETEGMIGLFINTLALRTGLEGNPSFLEMVKRVRDVSLAAQAYQDLPFEKLVEELRPRRSLNHSPFFQVLFNLQNTPESAADLPGLELEFMDLLSRSSKFDLSLSLSERQGAFGGSLEFNRDLFDAATARRMVDHLEILLGNAVAMPERPLSELEILSPPERRQLVQEASDSGRPVRPACCHELFEEQARCRPDAPAVSFQGERLTYGELDARANRLAHRLRSLGVGPEVCVGICVERSLEMVVGLLAVLKAGGAYLPMDPSYPANRLAFMVEDARVPVLLTQQASAAALPSSEAIVVDIDEARESAAAWPADRPAPAATPQNLAYVIYTSGSTGRPKGVQIPHAALVNFLDSMAGRPGISVDDRLAAVTSLSFDIAGLEIFLPLLAGAEVVVADRETTADALRLQRLLRDRGITIMQATPATWRMLVEAGWEGRDGLKILCGGEALPRALAHALAARGASLWNLYGPTETTIWSAVSSVGEADRAISLGRPIANTQVHLLDRDLGLVPYNVAGEVHIGGDGLARGYLGRPELTAERFIPDPHGSVPGARLYKTGDLARRPAGGDLEFLGRLDHQVKVRGYRIELGEIEAALHRHGAVREAVVVAHEDGGGTQRLVAYWVPREGESATASELLAHVRRSLPEQMVPAVLVQLPTLPLTPNGKVDRKALPDPAGERPDLASTYMPPSSEAERKVAGIWKDALQVEQIGIHDNFFDLGGHSLLMVQVQGRLAEAFRVEVPVIELFRHPTVASLAGFITRQQPEEVKVQEGVDRAETRRAAMARRGRARAREDVPETEP
ncbi:MAG: non-ribosomal peptide synthase/polyketide synthase [Acidobacteria bacterium]|nr:non-ribosomal peptide synthase/polyketide synthase [Acidobacteriota bacterium]